MIQFAEQYLETLHNGMKQVNLLDIKKIVDVVMRAKRNGRQIFVMGNGGSAALASHFACDLGKGTIKNFYGSEHKRFRVIALTDNIPTMTAYGNDRSYADIFAQQLNNLVNEGDVVIAISSSGNSPNVVNAIQLANRRNATTVSLVGFRGGKLKDEADYSVHFSDNHYGRSEDAHHIICHIIANWIIDIESQTERKELSAFA